MLRNQHAQGDHGKRGGGQRLLSLGCSWDAEGELANQPEFRRLPKRVRSDGWALTVAGRRPLLRFRHRYRLHAASQKIISPRLATDI